MRGGWKAKGKGSSFNPPKKKLFYCIKEPFFRRKEQEDRELEKLREKLGKCGDGSWVNVGYYNTLVRMGFTEKVRVRTLKILGHSRILKIHWLG